MEITHVRVFRVEDEKLKAYVSVVLDSCFMVNDIRVVRGKDGLFISMPSRKKRNGEFKDVAHPVNQETRDRFEERILAEYRALETGVAAVPQISPPLALPLESADAAGTLEQIERRHLDDRFWGVV